MDQAIVVIMAGVFSSRSKGHSSYDNGGGGTSKYRDEMTEGRRMFEWKRSRLSEVVGLTQVGRLGRLEQVLGN